MSWLPRSPKARARLLVIAAAAPVLAGAVALSLWAMQDAVVFFYGPSEATAGVAPEGRKIRIGGMVREGSTVRHGSTTGFDVVDGAGLVRVRYAGDLPDLFREGQGVVAEGSFGSGRVFHADRVLAKHDETYMPREVADRLKASGHWNPPAARSSSPG